MGMVEDPPGADSARLLLRKFYPLELKVLVERGNRAIPPNDIVFFERSKEFGPLYKFPSYSVQNKAGVKCRDEGNVYGETRRVFNLFDLHSVDLLALVFRHEIDLFDALAEGCSLKEGFKTRKASPLIRSISEDLAADATSKNFANYKW
jgi:hypothetical protein